MKNENNMIQKGTILTAKNECQMNGNQNLKALIIGKDYEVLALTQRNLVIKSEISSEHYFELNDDKGASCWRNYFKLKNENNIKTTEEINEMARVHANLKPDFDRAEEEYYNSTAINAFESFKKGYTQCQQDNGERELSDKIFELANELAVAGYGNEAVFLHNIRNRMILTTLNKQ